MGDFFKDHIFAGHAVVGCSSVALSSSLTHPIDTLKTLQVGAGPSQQPRFFQVADRVRFASGLSGLYNGFSWSILGSISGLSVRFGAYEILTAFYKDGRKDNYVYVSEVRLAGMAAGGVEAVICTPLELLKLRKQVASASGCRTISTIKVMQDSTPMISKLLPSYTPDMRAWNSTVGILSNLFPKHTDIVGALKHYPWVLTGSGRPPLASEVKRPRDIISLEGWNSLWRGLRSGIAWDCVFGGIFFSTWQFLHIAMLNWKAIDINPPPRKMETI